MQDLWHKSELDFSKNFGDLLFVVEDNKKVPPLSLLVDVYLKTGVYERSNSTIWNEKETPSQFYFGERVLEFDKAFWKLIALGHLFCDEYKLFVNGQGEGQLSLDSFKEFKAKLDRYLPTPHDKQTLILLIIYISLERVDPIIQELRKELKLEIPYDASRKEVLAASIKRHSDKKKKGVFESFFPITDQNRETIINIIACDLNFAQFLQGENVPGSLQVLRKLSAYDLNMYEILSFFQLVASGFKSQDLAKSTTNMLQTTYNTVIRASESLSVLSNYNYSPESVYDHYLKFRGDSLHLDVHYPMQRALIRLCCMMRFTTAAEASLITEAWKKLSYEDQQALRKELNTCGTTDGTAIILYYGPNLLLNTVAAKVKQPSEKMTREKIEAIELALRAMLRLYKISRSFLVDKKQNKKISVFSVDIADVANGLAKEKPDSLLSANLTVITIGNDGKITVSERA